MLDRRKTYKVVIHDNRRNGLSDTTEYAIKAEIVTDEGITQLGYWNFERGHLLDGRVKKELRNGIVFKATALNWTLTLTELTMEEFETEIRPRLAPEVSAMLNDLDDVYTWCRQQAGIN